MSSKMLFLFIRKAKRRKNLFPPATYAIGAIAAEIKDAALFLFSYSATKPLSLSKLDIYLELPLALVCTTDRKVL
jgi:hypothetical protein